MALWFVTPLRKKVFGFEPWPGTCVVFLGKTLDSHSTSLHPGAYWWELTNVKLGVTLRWSNIPSRMGGGGRNTLTLFMLQKLDFFFKMSIFIRLEIKLLELFPWRIFPDHFLSYELKLWKLRKGPSEKVMILWITMWYLEIFFELFLLYVEEPTCMSQTCHTMTNSFPIRGTCRSTGATEPDRG